MNPATRHYVVRRLLLNSPAGWFVAQLKRAYWAIGNIGKTLLTNTHWFFTSREHTNFTYWLTEPNRQYLAHFVANLSGQKPAEVLKLFDELEQDTSLSEYVAKVTLESNRRWFADSTPKFGRRLAWYSLVRILKPQLVVETGTDKGFGSLVIYKALEKNGSGALITMDTNPDAGYLVSSLEPGRVQFRFGDSVELLSQPDFPAIDIFIHDSLHTYEHEMAEFSAAFANLRPGGILISDNSVHCEALSDFAASHDWVFHYFREEVARHPYAGGGIGLACKARPIRREEER